MNSSTRLAVILGLQLSAGAAFLACGGDDEPKASGDGTTTDGDNAGASEDNTLQIEFPRLYSAFIEGHDSLVPVSLKDKSIKGATFTSTATDVADIVANADGTAATITVKKAGKTTIRVKAPDGETGAAALNVTAFTEADWTEGKNRYSASVSALNVADGGTATPIALLAPGGRNADGACTTCHGDQATLFDIQHGPLQTAGYTDEELITIFTMGTKPAGAVQKTAIPPVFWNMFHAWNVTDAQKKGLVAYLRTLPSKPNGVIDYGVRVLDGGALVDNAGNPIMLPGIGGGFGRRDGGGGGGGGGGAQADAGGGTTTTTPDAGAASSGADAGT